MRKHLFFILGIALTVIFFAVSCTEPEPEVPNASVHVYAAGSYLSDFGPAVLWTDGVDKILDSKSSDPARAVFVHGSDVYVGGSDINFHPVIWKNGVAQILSNEEGCVYDVKVINNKVYAAGHVELNAAYWINGVITELPNDPNTGHIMEARAIWVEGSDIYVCGTTWNEDRACYWKNGIYQSLSNKAACAEDICFHNGKLYIVGGESYTEGGMKKSVMWVNGTIQDIVVVTSGTHKSKATSIAFMNNDPYVVVESKTNNVTESRYEGYLWKSGTVTKLKDCSHPKDIYIHSGDYYIAGYNRVDDMQEKPVVLKNDEHLTINTLWGGCCFSVFVK